jgi:hypothetical protein
LFNIAWLLGVFVILYICDYIFLVL